MKEIINKALSYAVDNDIYGYMQTTDSIFTTQDDSCGQRQCKFQYFGYGKPDKESYPGVYKILRHCSFINKTDDGKEDAVLGILYTDKITDNTKCVITNNSIEFGNIIIRFYSDIKFD